MKDAEKKALLQQRMDQLHAARTFRDAAPKAPSAPPLFAHVGLQSLQQPAGSGSSGPLAPDPQRVLPAAVASAVATKETDHSAPANPIASADQVQQALSTEKDGVSPAKAEAGASEKAVEAAAQGADSHLGEDIATCDFKDLGSADFSKPLIITGLQDVHTSWSAQKEVQSTCTQYVGSYKKNPQLQSAKRHSECIQKGVAFDETGKFLKKMIHDYDKKVVDLSRISPSWGNVSWLWSMGVGSWQLGVTPSCAGLLRFVSLGSVSTVAIPPDSVLGPTWRKPSRMSHIMIML